MRTWSRRAGAVLGALRGLDPGRAAGRADPVRQRDPGPPGDARVGKRTLPVRFSREVVIRGYNVAAAAAYVALVAGVVAGILPVPTLLMLLSIPLALRVSQGLAPNYDNPYGLMAIMGTNVQLTCGRDCSSRRVRDRAHRRRPRAVVDLFLG